MPWIEKVGPIVNDAANAILQVYAGDIQKKIKKDATPVTVADFRAHEIISAGLSKLSRDIPVLSEEGPEISFEVRKSWQRYWCVDPLDGTKEFINKSGEFTVNIALITDGVPTFGLLYNPVSEILYYGETGVGSFKRLGGKTEQIFSEIPKKNRLRVAHSRAHSIEDIRSFLKSTSSLEGFPVSSALKFGMLAEGAVDVYVRLLPCSEWDVAAGDCIFRNSGKGKPRKSPLRYRGSSLIMEPFVIGLD